MKPTLTSAGGRTPPWQNALMPCAGPHSPGAGRGSRVPVPSSHGHLAWDARALAENEFGLLDPIVQRLRRTGEAARSCRFALIWKAHIPMPALARGVRDK